MSSPIASSTPFSGFSVDDIDAARGVLRRRPRPGRRRWSTGCSASASPMTSTCWPTPSRPRAGDVHVLNLPVADIDAAVDELVRRGVSMLRYDGDAPGREGHRARAGRAAGAGHRLVHRSGRQHDVRPARGLAAAAVDLRGHGPGVTCGSARPAPASAQRIQPDVPGAVTRRSSTQRWWKRSRSGTGRHSMRRASTTILAALATGATTVAMLAVRLPPRPVVPLRWRNRLRVRELPAGERHQARRSRSSSTTCT